MGAFAVDFGYLVFEMIVLGGFICVCSRCAQVLGSHEDFR